MVTSPPYPMISNVGRTLLLSGNPKIAESFHEIGCNRRMAKLCREIYDAMHNYLSEVWAETFRVLVDGGIACINIGDATRSINGKFQLYPKPLPNHRSLRKNRIHNFAVHPVEKTHQQTNVQG